MGVTEHLTCVFLRVENKRASRWQARFSHDTILGQDFVFASVSALRGPQRLPAGLGSS